MINKIKYIPLLLILFLFVPSVTLSAQPATPWWLSLEQGKQKFRTGDFGGALISFEDARRHRRAMYEQLERDFILFLSVNEVRRIGDSLDRVESFSYERRYDAASKALEELYYRIPKASFNNSAASALLGFARLKDYPEAEYWIGEVYRIEGELSLALAQYRRAFSMRGVLEDPGFSTTIQYKISDMLRVRQEYNEMIRILDSIIAEKDTLWSDAAAKENHGGTDSRGNPIPAPYSLASASFAKSAMLNTIKEHGFNRFMVMYRYNNSVVEKAHRLLGFHYALQGRSSAEDHLMFAFLIQNTVIIEEVRRRQFDFLYSDLPSLARQIDRSPLLLSYIEEVEYYKTAYYFAASLYREGKTGVARTIWSFLASRPQAGEWHGRAVSQLNAPRFEPIVERP